MSGFSERQSRASPLPPSHIDGSCREARLFTLSGLKVLCDAGAGCWLITAYNEVRLGLPPSCPITVSATSKPPMPRDFPFNLAALTNA
jgi:hypothetical protein